MAKVLIVAPYVPHPPQHGGGIRSRVLIEALSEGHDVCLMAAVSCREDQEQAEDLAKEAGIQVIPVPARAAAPASFLRKLSKWLLRQSEIVGRRWVMPRARDLVREVVEREQFDLCIVDSTWALPIGPKSATLLFLHNLEYSMYARVDDSGRRWSDRLTRAMESKRLRDYERAAIKRHAMTVVVSEEDRRLALGLVPGARVEVVANSVDLARLVPEEPPAADGPLRLLFVGSLDYPPNLEAVTELVELHLPVLREAFPQLTVRVVGRDPQDLGGKFAGIEGLEMVGAVEDVAVYYRGAHAVYLPIRSGGGTRIKILEAWALGVPVLSTEVGSEGLDAQDGEHLLRFESPEEGVRALMSLPKMSETLRRSGRLLVEGRYSHDAAMVRLKGLILEALSLKGR